jgi:hypothetical protein
MRTEKTEEQARRAEAKAARAVSKPARATKKAAPTEIKIGQRALSERQQELLGHLKVESNVAVYQPDGFIDDWAELKAIMLALGGTWKTGGKKRKGGFRFPEDLDAAELVRLALESGEILDARVAEFFETPDALADELAAFIDPQPGDIVLEPSAGRGALLKAIRRRRADVSVVCIEPFGENRVELRRLGFDPYDRDFLAYTPASLGGFDGAILNPPFSKRADVHHILHALTFLKPGGRIAAIASSGVKYRDDKLGREFRAEIERHGGAIVDNAEGAFLASGTGVRTCMVRMVKRA